jgi:hypothetical protein
MLMIPVSQDLASTRLPGTGCGGAQAKNRAEREAEAEGLLGDYP